MTALLQATPAGFLRDGEPHTIISGAIHYFRIHPDQWRDRLRRVVALGCNTIETYVAWNIHQPSAAGTTFEGIADLGRFLDIAAEEGLDAIVRPGPYICAEWEGGGFPGWILKDRGMRLRTRDSRFVSLVDAWFDELIPVIAERQASRGGNVVMVQVENEYGSFGDDKRYLAHLRDGLRARGIEELLVTSDGPSHSWLQGGTVDGALATVNFGSRTLDVLEMAADELPDQPIMCMEFWNGWFDHWSEPHHTRPAADAADELAIMLDNGMSVNFYMAHGGTNFGMTAGANHDRGLEPTTTSYDYDSPIAENGALTDKFHAFREVIGRHADLPPLEEHLAQLDLVAEPAHLPAGPVAIEQVAGLVGSEYFTRAASVHPMPPAFEDVGLERGFQRLSRTIELERRVDDSGASAVEPLKLYGLHDRAWVYVDGHFAGIGWCHDEPAVVDLTPIAEAVLDQGETRREARVDVVVENLGRTNFGPYLGERKGILGGIWHGIRFRNDWEADAWPVEQMGREFAAVLAADGAEGSADDDSAVDGAAARSPLPALVRATFEADAAADAFLDVSTAGHGVAYVNGNCVGRYWNVGPQQSLYVPAPWIQAGTNEVVLLEFEKLPEKLALADGHVWDTPGEIGEFPAR
jgi:beta-galactosidase